MVEVRAESSRDAQAIRHVHSNAFPTAAEADLVDRLRRDGDHAVSLVAVAGDELIGHVLLSPMDVLADGKQVSALGLGPVAVLPGRQRQGIGCLLVETALGAARAGGADLVFVLGDPDYYARFGFTAESAEPFASPYAGPYFQALVMDAGMRAPVTGRADYAPAFASLG